MIAVLVVLVAAVVALVGYLTTCMAYPHVDCKKCEGAGEVKHWFFTRMCKRCGGEGYVSRTGAYVMIAMRTPRP